MFSRYYFNCLPKSNFYYFRFSFSVTLPYNFHIFSFNSCTESFCSTLFNVLFALLRNTNLDGIHIWFPTRSPSFFRCSLPRSLGVLLYLIWGLCVHTPYILLSFRNLHFVWYVCNLLSFTHFYVLYFTVVIIICFIRNSVFQWSLFDPWVIFLYVCVCIYVDCSLEVICSYTYFVFVLFSLYLLSYSYQYLQLFGENDYLLNLLVVLTFSTLVVSG